MWGIALGLLKMLPGFSEGVFTWLNKKTDADLEKYKTGVTGDTAINVEEIRTRVALAQAGNDRVNGDRQSLWTVWMVPTAFLFFMGHAASVVVYSMLWCKKCAYPQPWVIAELPDIYANMQANVILTICGVAGVGVALKKLFTK